MIQKGGSSSQVPLMNDGGGVGSANQRCMGGMCIVWCFQFANLRSIVFEWMFPTKQSTQTKQWDGWNHKQQWSSAKTVQLASVGMCVMWRIDPTTRTLPLYIFSFLLFSLGQNIEHLLGSLNLSLKYPSLLSASLLFYLVTKQ